MIREFIKKHIDDYTDSFGEIDSIGLIELVQKEFGIDSQRAEEYVTDYLDETE